MSAAGAVATGVSRANRANQRGDRRAAILAATVRILGTEGLTAVKHRAVAREADVPLAATTYYFSSKDELIAEALAILVQDEVERLAARAAAMGDALASPADAAAAMAEALFPDPLAAGGMLAKFEVYLAAARTPGLRNTAAHWQDAFTRLAEDALALAGSPDPERLAPTLVAGVDGILVHELSAGVTGAGDAVRLRLRLEQLFALVLDAD